MKRLLLAATATWLASASFIGAQLAISPSAMRAHPEINYLAGPTTDPVARLNVKLASGEVQLRGEPTNGYLRSILQALDVPVESQILVFSKTSFQSSRIGPGNPRAIYFNDQVAVGWVRGGEVLEFASHDPAQGTVFYTLAQPGTGPMTFRRNNTACVQCHSSEATSFIPGMFIGSVYPEKDGMPAYGPAYLTDHRTPFELRWGGWYVTGDHSGHHCAVAGFIHGIVVVTHKVIAADHSPAPSASQGWMVVVHPCVQDRDRLPFAGYSFKCFCCQILIDDARRRRPAGQHLSLFQRLQTKRLSSILPDFLTHDVLIPL